MKIFLFLTTLLISFGFTNAQSSGSSDVSGVYQAFYMNSEPIDVDGLSMYYILNSKGVVLISLGSSSGSAFSNTSEGIRNGRITGGS